MKAILISPETQSIEMIEIADLDDIKKIIGFDSVISDECGSQGDRLYFDEDCFLRGTEGRFQIDTLVPVAGKGVIVGSADEESILKDIVADINNLKSRIKYL